jgi:ribose-phosphate pyrophosphokinase
LTHRKAERREGREPPGRSGQEAVIAPAPQSLPLPKLFALNATRDLGQAVAGALGWPLARHEEREFEDGEHKIRPLESVEGADVFVLQSLHGGPHQSPDEKLCRLLFFIGALKDAGAARVTAVTPYLCFARKDRRTKPFDPVTQRYLAQMIEAVGTDAVVTLDVHNPAAFQNAFRIRTVALTAAALFAERFTPVGPEPVCVLSPDPGGVKRAEVVREALEARLGRPVDKAFADKHRSAGVVSGDLLVGPVQGATVLIVDDLISTGGTLLRAARAARAAGAKQVTAATTHGLFMPGAAELLTDPAIDRLMVTDAVPPFRLTDDALRLKVETVSIVPLLAEAIQRLHRHGPVEDLITY